MKLLEMIGITAGEVHTIRGDGSGYLQTRFEKWMKMAQRSWVLRITDLDRNACVSTLMDSWSHDRKPPEKLVFRIAVREVESWLLADYVAMRELIGKKAGCREIRTTWTTRNENC